MRQPHEWDEDDILALIRDGVKESLVLDYKECRSLDRTDGKKDEISKDVSAFANSDGGTIVYGVVEDKHLPIAVDAGYDPTVISKEWLESVINSRIQRRVDGVRINQIDLNNTSPGKVIYVVQVPQSRRAPHMAADHRFYKRFNFQSTPMEEYEVRDVANRTEAPDLRLIFNLPMQTEMPLVFDGGEPFSKPVELRVLITNDAPSPAEHIVVRLFIGGDMRIVDSGDLSIEQSSAEIGDQSVPGSLLRKNWSLPGQMPVWEGMRFTLAHTPLRISLPNRPIDHLVYWEIDSPRMAKKTGSLFLHSTGASVRIVKQEE